MQQRIKHSYQQGQSIINQMFAAQAPIKPAEKDVKHEMAVWDVCQQAEEVFENRQKYRAGDAADLQGAVELLNATIDYIKLTEELS